MQNKQESLREYYENFPQQLQKEILDDFKAYQSKGNFGYSCENAITWVVFWSQEIESKLRKILKAKGKNYKVSLDWATSKKLLDKIKVLNLFKIDEMRNLELIVEHRNWVLHEYFLMYNKTNSEILKELPLPYPVDSSVDKINYRIVLAKYLMMQVVDFLNNYLAPNLAHCPNII